MTTFMTPNFRVSFPHVLKTTLGYKNQQDPHYSMDMLFDMEKIKADPKQKELWKGMKAAMQAALVKKFGDKIPEDYYSPLRKGTEKSKKDKPGYGEGIVFAKAKDKTRPGLVDQNKQDIISAEDFYPGCYARATISAWAYDAKDGGVSFNLHNIQKIADGEPFGAGRSSTDDDFEALDTGGSDDLDDLDDLDDDDDDMLS